MVKSEGGGTVFLYDGGVRSDLSCLELNFKMLSCFGVPNIQNLRNSVYPNRSNIAAQNCLSPTLSTLRT